MGPIVLPTSGSVYVDANVVIYTVENHPLYAPRLRPFWLAVNAGMVRVFSSELLYLETLVGPHKSGSSQLAANYETFLGLPYLQLLPISVSILREAARLRASIPRLRTPDAIHAASARVHGVATFLSNDAGFRNVPGLNAVIVDDLLAGSTTP
jgi:predicted nucleic acid-binding protein